MSNISNAVDRNADAGRDVDGAGAVDVADIDRLPGDGLKGCPCSGQAGKQYPPFQRLGDHKN